MISVGIKEAKNSLSRLLDKVKAGEEVLLTDRGKPVARIVQEVQSVDPVRKNLIKLSGEGTIEMPAQNIRKNPACFPGLKGKSASEMVLEDRR